MDIPHPPPTPSADHPLELLLLLVLRLHEKTPRDVDVTTRQYAHRLILPVEVLRSEKDFTQKTDYVNKRYPTG